jgi:hypothetical protein
MKPDHIISVAEIASLFNEVLPLRADQQLIFSQLLDSITYCEQLGSVAWSITLLKTGFRLNVGQVEAMTWRYTLFPGKDLGYERDSTMSDIRLLLAGSDCLDKIDPSNENGVVDVMPYESVGAPHWCYGSTFQSSTDSTTDPSRSVVAGDLARLRSNHHQFLKLACTTPTGKLRQKSNFAQHHCESLYAYACSVVNGTSIPDQADDADSEAALLAAVNRSLADSAPARATRLAVAAEFPDRYESTTTVFRRNPDVIAEVLLRSAGHCEACHQPAPFVRASSGTPYLEVHHTVPLSAGGTDTVANAVGLCPNCHRVAHYA